MTFGKPWSKEETDLLISNHDCSVLTIRKELAFKGYHRSVGAIERKLQRVAKPTTTGYVQVSGPNFPATISFSEIEKSVKWISGSLELIKNKPTKFVMFNDVHVPDNIPLDNVFSFINDFKPDYILLVGDIVNNDPFSHWDRNSPLRFKNMPNPKSYYEKCNKLFYRPLRKSCGGAVIIHWIGNHEYWSEKAIAEMPEGAGYWEVQNNIEEIDLWVASKGVANLGKLHFMHGDIIKSGNGCSRKIVQLFHRNVRFGHFHHIEESSQTNPLDAADFHTARCCGTLQKLNPHYMNGQPSNWINAFTYGTVLQNGNFFDHTAVITNNSFMANGKIYE